MMDTEWQSKQFSTDLFPTRRLKPSANELVKSNLCTFIVSKPKQAGSHPQKEVESLPSNPGKEPC